MWLHLKYLLLPGQVDIKSFSFGSYCHTFYWCVAGNPSSPENGATGDLFINSKYFLNNSKLKNLFIFNYVYDVEVPYNLYIEIPPNELEIYANV